MASVILLSTLTVCAQDKKTLDISAGVELGLPMGDFGKAQGLGIGASLQGDYAISNVLKVTANIGYMSFLGKKSESEGVSVKSKALNFIPIRVGAKYFVTEAIHVGAQVGVGMFSGGGNATSGFNFSPQVGYMLSEKLDLTLKYDNTSKDGGSLGFIGLRAAYHF